VINKFSLNTPTTKYRFTGGVPDPSNKYYYTIMMTIDKAVDRYKVSKWQYATIDLAQKKVVKTVDLPDEDNTLNAARAYDGLARWQAALSVPRQGDHPQHL
jgi:hypothetical protein